MEYGIFKGLLGIGAGILLLAIDIEGIMSVVLLLFGVMTVLINVMRLVAVRNVSGTVRNVSAVMAIVGIVLGILLAVMRSSVLTLLIGIYMIVLPIADVLLSDYRSEQLKTVLPKLLFGIILVVVGPGKALNIVSDALGVVILVLSVIDLTKHVLNKKNC